MDNRKDIHPKIWIQLSPVQQWNTIVDYPPQLHKDNSNYFAARGNIITSPRCSSKQEAIEFDNDSMQKMRQLALSYNDDDDSTLNRKYQ